MLNPNKIACFYHKNGFISYFPSVAPTEMRFGEIIVKRDVSQLTVNELSLMFYVLCTCTITSNGNIIQTIIGVLDDIS